MKRISALLPALVLFAVISYAHPAHQQQKAKTHKKEVKKEGTRKKSTCQN